MRGDSGDWTAVREELGERSQGTEHLETRLGLDTRQPDLWPQDHFQRGLVEDLFADLHLCWPVHARQDGGIPWGESMVASPTSALPLGPRGAVCGPPGHRDPLLSPSWQHSSNNSLECFSPLWTHAHLQLLPHLSDLLTAKLPKGCSHSLLPFLLLLDPTTPLEWLLTVSPITYVQIINPQGLSILM